MKLPWFKRFGILFLPSGPVGWLITVAAFVFAIYKFIDIDSRSHSASDTLINFTFYLFLIGGVYSALAYLTSLRKN